MSIKPNDDLTPTDGLSDIWLEFDGMDQHMNSGNADFRFRFVLKSGDDESVLCVLSLPIEARDDGFPGMMVRAYDELIGLLRQGLYVSDKMRDHYRRELGGEPQQRT